MKLLPEHCKGARGMLSLSQGELAAATGLSLATIHLFEKGESDPTEDTLLRIQTALENRGIEFLNSGSPGVRLRRLRNPTEPAS